MKLGLVALGLLLVLSGCAGTADNSPTKTESQTVGNNQAAKDLAKNIPADFPLTLYPGAKVTNISKDTLLSGTVQTNVYTEIRPIKDSLTTIGTFYAQKLEADRWKLEERDVQLQNNDFYKVSARKGNEVVQMIAHNHDDWEPKVTSVDLTRFVQPGTAATAP